MAIYTAPPSTSTDVIEGAIEQHYDVKKIDPEKQIPLIEIDVPENRLCMSGGKKIYVEKIYVQGNTAISTKELQFLIEPYLNQNLSMQRIRELCSIIEKKYIVKGYLLAKICILEQVIKDHTITLSVFEGILGNVSIQGNHFYKDSFIQKYFSRFVGKAICYDSLLASLLLLNENDNLKVGAIFKKGKEIGTADLLLVVEDKRPLHFYLDYNNYGVSIISKNREGFRLDAGNLLFQGDSLSLIETIGPTPKLLNFTNLVYHVPLNVYGSSLDFSYLYSHFRLREQEELHMKGFTNIGGIKFRQALKRSRQTSIDLFSSFEIKQIKNLTLGTTSSYDKLRVAALGASFDIVDGAKGRNLAEAAVFVGIPNFLGGMKSISPHASRLGAGGYFLKGVIDFKRIQKLPWDSFLLGRFLTQITGNKLVLAEEMYLGGVDTVRGYAMAKVLGDKGYLVSLEARIPPPFLKERCFPFTSKKWKDALNLLFFIDHGGVFLTGAKAPNQKTSDFLLGVGPGLRLFGPNHLDFSFDLGIPILTKEKTRDVYYYIRLNWNPL